VPADCRAFGSKGAIALEEIDRLRAAGVRFGGALADSGHGRGAAFRHGLASRARLWAVGSPKTQKVYSAAVKLC
jgi:SRSO17 transposase